MTFLSTVDDKHGTAAVRVTPPKLTAAQRAEVERIIDEHVDAAVEATGMHRENVVGLFLAEATRRAADAAAYEREARRRGVLAL